MLELPSCLEGSPIPYSLDLCRICLDCALSRNEPEIMLFLLLKETFRFLEVQVMLSQFLKYLVNQPSMLL